MAKITATKKRVSMLAQNEGPVKGAKKTATPHIANSPAKAMNNIKGKMANTAHTTTKKTNTTTKKTNTGNSAMKMNKTQRMKPISRGASSASVSKSTNRINRKEY